MVGRRPLFLATLWGSSAVACVVLVLWLLSHLSGVWYARRNVGTNGGLAYVVVVADGYVHLQRVQVPGGLMPLTGSQWQGASGEAMEDSGPVSPRSIFEQVGLVDTLVRTPCDAPAGAAASSIQTSGRNVSIPLTMLFFVVGAVAGGCWVVRWRENRERLRRGFDVVPGQSLPKDNGQSTGSA